MSAILIAYATSEGQTAKICRAFEQQFETAGHTVELIDLESRDAAPDAAQFDAVIVAASVHAGKHQRSAVDFVNSNADALRSKPTAFVSVGLAIIAVEESGRRRADEQVESFLNEVDWKPGLIAKLGGAFRYSEFSGIRRWVFKVSQRLFKKDLDRQGWPDLTVDNEFTDWDQLRRFGEEFSAKL